jgi:pilus assembly protein CpaE
MYPFPIILVGCGESIRGHVRRELTNQLALVQTEFRDVDGALQHFAQLTEPDQSLVLMYVRTQQDLQQLQRLSTALPNKMILALRDRSGEEAMFRNALRAGATFAVPVPIDPEEFTTALSWISRQCGQAPKSTKVIAVAGVRGGCGASTLALNLAHEIGAQHQQRVLLIELSLRIGILATYLHVEPRHDINELIKELDNLDIDYIRQVLVPVNEHLHLLPGPQYAIESQNVKAADLNRLIYYTRALADVIVLDVACTYDDLYFETLTRTDETVLVWEQMVPSVRSLQMVREALQRNRAEQPHQTLVVNRYDPRIKGFTKPELESLLRVSGVRSVARDDAAVTASLNNGRPLRVQAPTSRALTDISALSHELLQLPEKTSKDRVNVFGRLVRSFGLTS